MMAELVDAGRMARRGKQYVLLKNWDFETDPRKAKPVSRVESVVANGVKHFPVPGASRRLPSFGVGAAA